MLIENLLKWFYLQYVQNMSTLIYTLCFIQDKMQNISDHNVLLKCNTLFHHRWSAELQLSVMNNIWFTNDFMWCLVSHFAAQMYVYCSQQLGKTYWHSDKKEFSLSPKCDKHVWTLCSIYPKSIVKSVR